MTHLSSQLGKPVLPLTGEQLNTGHLKTCTLCWMKSQFLFSYSLFKLVLVCLKFYFNFFFSGSPCANLFSLLFILIYFLVLLFLVLSLLKFNLTVNALLFSIFHNFLNVIHDIERWVPLLSSFEVRQTLF